MRSTRSGDEVGEDVEHESVIGGGVDGIVEDVDGIVEDVDGIAEDIDAVGRRCRSDGGLR